MGRSYQKQRLNLMHTAARSPHLLIGPLQNHTVTVVCLHTLECPYPDKRLYSPHSGLDQIPSLQPLFFGAIVSAQLPFTNLPVWQIGMHEALKDLAMIRCE